MSKFAIIDLDKIEGMKKDYLWAGTTDDDREWEIKKPEDIDLSGADVSIGYNEALSQVLKEAKVVDEEGIRQISRKKYLYWAIPEAETAVCSTLDEEAFITSLAKAIWKYLGE